MWRPWLWVVSELWRDLLIRLERSGKSTTRWSIPPADTPRVTARELICAWTAGPIPSGASPIPAVSRSCGRLTLPHGEDGSKSYVLTSADDMPGAAIRSYGFWKARSTAQGVAGAGPSRELGKPFEKAIPGQGLSRSPSPGPAGCTASRFTPKSPKPLPGGRDRTDRGIPIVTRGESATSLPITRREARHRNCGIHRTSFTQGRSCVFTREAFCQPSRSGDGLPLFTARKPGGTHRQDYAPEISPEAAETRATGARPWLSPVRCRTGSSMPAPSGSCHTGGAVAAEGDEARFLPDATTLTLLLGCPYQLQARFPTPAGAAPIRCRCVEKELAAAAGEVVRRPEKRARRGSQFLAARAVSALEIGVTAAGGPGDADGRCG